ncbi:MAG: PepSY domain-containing protein [Phycisphaerales bacterium JB039]
MRMLFLALGAVLLVQPAQADDDRPVTSEERAAIEQVLAAEGCEGGRYEFDIDDNEYEVEDAICADGQRYDFELDTLFQITDRDRDD